MSTPRALPKRRSPAAAALALYFKPKKVRPRRGRAAYRRNPKHKEST
jgi:hypothetical protein